MERITDKYVFFWGSILSNWYKCKFTYKNKEFSNTEQAYMWEKANYFNDNEIANLILKTPNPRENKKLGRKVKNFDEKKWTSNSYDYMVDVNYHKFNQNNDLKGILLSTGNKTIVEASPYDKIWGIGMGIDNDNIFDKTKWKGINLLGKALMAVRNKLKEKNID